MCASSAAMALTFDAGGRERQEDFWVGDLTEKEATELLIQNTVTGTKRRNSLTPVATEQWIWWTPASSKVRCSLCQAEVASDGAR